ncbi:MAG: CCA tRNA nucleotidyltransferase [Cyanobacteria bacterium SBLK]|nr:CCA tRNA nucleotidyltransferase [Cyanobacteria bacterium SBLK]
MPLTPNLSALSPRNLPFDLSLLPQPTYIVGGCVRDALLGRTHPYFDVDLVLPGDAVETARQIAGYYNAGFVILDEVRRIARVVFESGTADFAQQMGRNLKEDLKRRDFRINAIAYNPRTRKFIDPLKGRRDLEGRTIGAISKANLEDDPLRLLRAYRQAAQLDFTIDPKTRTFLSQLAPNLARISAERVRQELNYLLAAPKGDRWLHAAYEDGVLPIWLADATEESIKQIDEIDRVAWVLGTIWQDFAEYLHRPVGNSTSGLSLAKLASLVSPDPEIARSQLETLTYSRNEIRFVLTILQHYPSILSLGNAPMPLEDQYFFFQEVGNVFPALAVFGVAGAACRDILQENQATNAIAPLVNAYLDPENQAAHPVPLITGNDLIRYLGLRSSPALGQLLTRLQLARVTGEIATPEEALQFAATLIASPSSFQ